MTTLITVTDILDNPVREYNMGDIVIDDYSTIYQFRVWNNLRGLKKGIETATGIKIVLKYEPFQHHNAMSSRVEGNCVISGKLGTSIVEQMQSFPLEGTTYDELPSGTYNQYELRINLTNWPDERNFIIEDLLSKIYIVVELDN